jgi:hypothetical protein
VPWRFEIDRKLESYEHLVITQYSITSPVADLNTSPAQVSDVPSSRRAPFCRLQHAGTADIPGALPDDLGVNRNVAGERWTKIDIAELEQAYHPK